MAINPSLLVCPAIFQNFIEGKNGQPLSNGVITFYEDSNHTILKNVYQQTGTFPNYTYTAVNNPLTLSAAGTTVDVNGNDILLFFYPWSETDQNVAQPYFITVVDQYGTLQFTRSNFPFSNQGSPSPSTANMVAQNNYVLNNRFWRNISSLTPTSTNNTGAWTTEYSTSGTVAYWTLCPDQHDGFSMPDFNYIIPNSDIGNATETITFMPFSATTIPTLENDVQPEYYINHTCTADSGTYTKIYQFPISLHLASLANQPFVFTIQGEGAITLTATIYAFGGSGTPSPVILPFEPIVLTSTWTKYSRISTFPSNFGVATSTTGDDAFYLQIQFSSGAADFNFALPSLYIYDNEDEEIDGDQLFSFSTYDQIDTIINSPRTGDVRLSMNKFYPFGWVPMNDGLIGLSNPGSSNQYARANIDTWPLFNMLWNFGKTYDSGSTSNPLFQMYTNTSGTLAAANYGSTALADFNATSPSKALQLPFAMGEVLLGTVPISALLPGIPTFSNSKLTGYKSTVTASSSSGLLFTVASSNILNIFTGNTVTFTSTGSLPGNIVANAIYYVAFFSSTTFKVATSFANLLAGTYVSYSSSGSGTITAYMQLTGSGEGEYSHTQLEAELASHTHSYTHTVTNTIAPASGATGPVTTTSANTGSTGSSTPFNVTQPGVFYNIYIKL